MSAPNAYTPVIPIAPFYQFTEFTPAVPNLYWDVYSAEERMKKLCMENLHDVFKTRIRLILILGLILKFQCHLRWTKYMMVSYCNKIHSSF